MKSSFKTALIAAVVSAFVAAGAAVATTQTFQLGTSNAPDAQTSVVAKNVDGLGGINAPMFKFTNSSTGGSATPLSLTAGAGRPPLAVGNKVKVANLNADLVDGIDSTGFVRGRGTFLANRIVFVPTNMKTLLTIPGLGYLKAICISTDVGVNWVNDTGGNVDVWRDAFFSHFHGEIAANGAELGVASRANGADGGTLALGVGNDPNARRTALLHVFVFQSGDNAPCGFEAQGTLWTSQ
jgi:hypothetical protein